MITLDKSKPKPPNKSKKDFNNKDTSISIKNSKTS